MKSKILSFLKKNKGLEFKFNSVAQNLQINKANRATFRKAINSLTKENLIEKRGKYYSLKEEKHTEKILPDTTSPLPKNKLNKELIKFVSGRFSDQKHYGVVIPDSREIKRDIIISKTDYNGAENDDKVFCEILNPEDKDYEFSELNGIILTVFGKAGEPDVEIQSVMSKYGLVKKFPQKVSEEADKIKYKTVLKDRLDLRDKIIFTIDPYDAKDFDDAISLEKDKDGNYLLGVHIADVSHFVEEGTELDREAFKRGTSVYLVDQVVPMLPEKLSNDICSLKPNVDRLTYSIIITLNGKSEVLDFRITKSAINSKRRFTYEEAQQIVDSGNGDFAAELKQMMELSKSLTKKRLKEGSLDFETKEVKFVLSKNGKVKDIRIKERLDSMRLVEEFMLLANKCATLFISDLQKMEKRSFPFIYRVHDKPDTEKLAKLNEFIKQFGYNVNISSKHPDKKQLKKLLESIKGKPEEYIINDLLIRSMAKAVYHHKNIGHYGLGFDDYTHFTSPIRRYPDLVVHRLLYLYGKGGHESTTKLNENKDAIKYICQHSSLAEQNAVTAEREITKIKQIEYLSDKMGYEYNGVISGIADRGMFIEIMDLLIEGMVRFKDIEDDYYTYDERKHCAVGRRYRKIFRAGDEVRVKVLKVNAETRKIDFLLMD